MKLMILVLILSWLLQIGAPGPAGSRPLPPLDSFLQGIRSRLHSNRIVQSRYTYTERSISRQLDGDGNVKGTETRVYEVYPSLEEELTYRKLISKNDKPLTEEEIRKQDSAFDKKLREWGRKLERRKEKEAEALKKEEAALDEAFRLYEITMTGRESMGGIPVIGLAFAPHPGYRPMTDEGKILSKVRGRAWFGEADHELVRIEAELCGSLSFGLGVVAKLNQGARLVFERRRVNDEVWLPSMSRFTGTGKILVLKGFRIDQETLYSDYQKFSVETLSKIQPPADAAEETP